MVAVSQEEWLLAWQTVLAKSPAAQVVQKLEGRPSRESSGTGHCAPVLAVSCHPRKSLIASGALGDDNTIKLWSDANGDQPV